MKKIIKGLGKANSISIFGPENIRPQTDYNPVRPGSDVPPPADMRPSAVQAREKAARRALIVPAVIIAAVALILIIAILIKK